MWISKKRFELITSEVTAQNHIIDIQKRMLFRQKQLNKYLVARINQLQRNNPDETIKKTNQ